MKTSILAFLTLAMVGISNAMNVRQKGIDVEPEFPKTARLPETPEYSPDASEEPEPSSMPAFTGEVDDYFGNNYDKYQGRSSKTRSVRVIALTEANIALLMQYWEWKQAHPYDGLATNRFGRSTGVRRNTNKQSDFWRYIFNKSRNSRNSNDRKDSWKNHLNKMVDLMLKTKSTRKQKDYSDYR